MKTRSMARASRSSAATDSTSPRKEVTVNPEEEPAVATEKVSEPQATMTTTSEEEV